MGIRGVIWQNAKLTPSFRVFKRTGKEITWDINKVAVDSIEVREKCTKQLAQSVRKNAKSLSSRAATVRYIARNAFQSASRGVTGLTHGRITGPEKEVFTRGAVSIKDRPEEGKRPLKRISHFLHIEKNVPKN